MYRMIPWVGVVACCALVGCGPMTGPMPQPLPDDKQKELDDAWTKALTPVDKHDRQQWLDVVVTAYPYQCGVEELHLRSVKKWDGGTVVMEIRTNRATPDDDSITVTVLDKAGKQLRTEKYLRSEVERTTREFEGKRRDGQPLTPAEEAAIEARVKRVEAIMPDFVFRPSGQKRESEMK